MKRLQFKCGIKPPHHAHNEAKLRSMVHAIQCGEQFPPIVVLPTGRAITGSHRLAAYAELGLIPPIVFVTTKEYNSLIKYMDNKYFIMTPQWVEINICHELRQVTDRRELINALSGQSQAQNTKGLIGDFKNIDKPTFYKMIEGVIRWLVDYDGYESHWAFGKENKGAD